MKSWLVWLYHDFWWCPHWYLWSVQSSSEIIKNPFYDCVGWLFSLLLLEHDNFWFILTMTRAVLTCGRASKISKIEGRQFVPHQLFRVSFLNESAFWNKSFECMIQWLTHEVIFSHVLPWGCYYLFLFIIVIIYLILLYNILFIFFIETFVHHSGVLRFEMNYLGSAEKKKTLP